MIYATSRTNNLKCSIIVVSQWPLYHFLLSSIAIRIFGLRTSNLDMSLFSISNTSKIKKRKRNLKISIFSERVDGGPVCVCDHSSDASRSVCDHSQTLWSLSVWTLWAGDHWSATRSLSLSFARRLVEASGLARSFVRVPYIRTFTSPSHSRASLSRVSLVSGLSLVSWHVSLSLDVPLIPPIASPLLSPLSRGSARLQTRLHGFSIRD